MLNIVPNTQVSACIFFVVFGQSDEVIDVIALLLRH